MSIVSPYQRAIETVKEWFDSDGAAYAERIKDRSFMRSPMAWNIDVPGTVLSGRHVRLVLPDDFPASCPRVYTEKNLCLKLPHIEEDGRICLGVTPIPLDYEEPCGAIGRVLRALEEYLCNCGDPAWIEAEFQKECLSYWLRHCEDERKARSSKPTARINLVSLVDFATHAEGTVALYSHKGPAKRPRAMVICAGDLEPQEVAQRHKWSGGTLTKGHALFISMPSTQQWTPSTWPDSFQALERLVADLTEYQVSVLEWIREKLEKRAQTFVVVLVQNGVAYGYQIHPADVWRIELPRIQPIRLFRVDSAWALSRDHGVDIFRARQNKKVLVLGCGSLGSPLIELLARAGVGHIEILDNDFFETENCARHILGLSSTRGSKASRLAERLKAELPGIEVKAHLASATTWLAKSYAPGAFDLVIDCTAESTVRTALAQCEVASPKSGRVVFAWLEPFCAAAHVVGVCAPDSWPLSDPADDRINAADWPESTAVPLPACSAGFHPYGAADAWQAAGFAAERVLAFLDGNVSESMIWSWVRSRAFFASLGMEVRPRDIVPTGESRFDAVMLTREYHRTLGINE